MKYFFQITILLFFINGQYSNTSLQVSHLIGLGDNLKDSIPATHIVIEKERKQKRKHVEDTYFNDSIRLSKVLKSALSYANRNKAKSAFKHEFKMSPDDSSFDITASLYFGNLFSKGKKHLIIKLESPGDLILKIYLLENGRFTGLCEQELSVLNYLDDTLKDVNGDNYKDFLVHWYPSSGCCRGDVYDVYLYLPETGKLTSSYKFINPTFSAKEKIIRGVEYGHPGDAGLYKYKWNSLNVDTVEFIYPDTSFKNRFYITKQQDWHRPPLAKAKIVNKLPTEYQNIESIDWFLMYRENSSK